MLGVVVYGSSDVSGVAHDYNALVRLRIVTWNTNQTLPHQRLTNQHWKELEKLCPSVLIFTECKDLGNLPGWIADWRPSIRGVAIAVSTGRLRDIDLPFVRAFKTNACTWHLGAETSICVAGVHIHKAYGRDAESWLGALKAVAAPLIAAGDFNINRDYNEADFKRFNRARDELRLRSCWHAARSAEFGGEPPTWRNYWGNGLPRMRNERLLPNFMLDYVLTSNHFSVLRSEIAEMEEAHIVEQKRWVNSDHRAVWAEVSLNGPHMVGSTWPFPATL